MYCFVVTVKPKIRGDSRSKDVTVLAGEPFRVDIPFESTPAPHVTMTQDDKGGAEVSFGGRFNVEVRQILQQICAYNFFLPAHRCLLSTAYSVLS